MPLVKMSASLRLNYAAFLPHEMGLARGMPTCVSFCRQHLGRPSPAPHVPHVRLRRPAARRRLPRHTRRARPPPLPGRLRVAASGPPRRSHAAPHVRAHGPRPDPPGLPCAAARPRRRRRRVPVRHRRHGPGPARSSGQRVAAGHAIAAAGGARRGRRDRRGAAHGAGGARPRAAGHLHVPGLRPSDMAHGRAGAARPQRPGAPGAGASAARGCEACGGGRGTAPRSRSSGGGGGGGGHGGHRPTRHRRDRRVARHRLHSRVQVAAPWHPFVAALFVPEALRIQNRVCHSVRHCARSVGCAGPECHPFNVRDRLDPPQSRSRRLPFVS